MTNGPVSRRRVIATLGLSIVPIAGCVSTASEWVSADAPTDATLTDVVTTSGGAFAVGADGVILRRGETKWSIYLEDVPSGEQHTLRSADVTSNGRVVWFCGDSGALGAYDTVAEHTLDLSVPDDRTSSWEAIAISGIAGSERIFLVSSSGELHLGRRDGPALEWIEATEVGTGSSVTGLDVTSLEYGYFCDTSGSVYESVDAGESWDRIGIENSGVDFYDILAVHSGHILVAGDDGIIYRYDGSNWSRTTVGEDPITAVAGGQYDNLAVSTGGVIYERSFDGWVELNAADSGDDLLAITLGTARTPQIVVGESGRILERRKTVHSTRPN